MSADEPGGAVVTGPLARYEAAFRGDLMRAGYMSRSVRDLVRTMARASRWLENRGLQAGGITPPVAADLEAGVPGSGPVLRFLRHAGVVDAGAGSGAGPVAALLAEFGAWLTGERGLSPVTVRCYRKHARVFLAGLAEPLDEALQRLDAGQVTSFMLGYCQDRNTESAKAMVTAIRALLRFVHVSGRTPVLLVGAVPAVAGWRLASLPRGLAAGQVGQLLDSCDRDTVTGRRDYAILTVLARLGLRGAEAAALQLGDIDWRAGEVMIRGKGSPARPAPAAGPGRRGAGRLAVRGPGPVRIAGGVRDRARPVPAAVTGGGARDHGPRLRPGRPGPPRRAPAASFAGDRDAARGRVAARGRAGTPAPEPAGHQRVCQGRSERAARAGPPLAGRRIMSTLRAAAEEYLAMRRALGFKLETQGRQLMSFTGYCEARGAERITAELALAWATQTSRGSSDEVYQSRRLMVVRIFARHLAALDPATEVPPEDMLPHHYRRIAPYLYSPGEITALMAAAGRLAPPLRAATWQTLIGLLAVTGIRNSEACHLDRDQVDLGAGVLTITDSKFGKSRQVFLHPTTVAALRGYQRRRDRWYPGRRRPASSSPPAAPG